MRKTVILTSSQLLCICLAQIRELQLFLLSQAREIKPVSKGQVIYLTLENRSKQLNDRYRLLSVHVSEL